MAQLAAGSRRLFASRAGRILLSVSGVALIVVAWWVAADVLSLASGVLPTVAEVTEAARPSNEGMTTFADFRETARSTAYGVGLAVVTGIPLGSLLARVPLLKRYVQPFLSVYLAFPNVAFIPILILLFGFGPETVIVLGFLTGFPYVIVNAQLAFERLEVAFRDVSQVYCRSAITRFFKIGLPAALPALASGTRIGAGRTMMGVVVGEMFASNTGIGARLVFTANFFNMPGFFLAFVALLVLAGLVLGLFQGLESASRRTYA